MFEGHARRSIGDLCDFFNGNGFRPPDWRPSGLPIIRIQNLNGSQNFNYFDGEPKPKWIVEPGDLLFAWAGVKGVSFGPTIWPGPRGVLNQHIFRIVPKKGVDKYWLYLALQVATRRIESNAHGFKSSLVHVQKDDITNQVVDLPPLPEQRKIAEILRTWDEAIAKRDALHANKAQRLDALRDMLMARGSRVGVPTTFGAFLKESRIPGGDGSTARKITVSVERTASTQTKRCDIVAYVNGIPFLVIENERPTESLKKAGSQLIGYQNEDNFPQLFHFTQLLMVMNRVEARYATVGTPRQFWQT